MSAVRRTYEEYIAIAKLKHNNKFHYNDNTKISYENRENKIPIICPVHGIFKQNAYGHLTSGCATCRNDSYRSSLEEFIEKSNLKHKNKYIYTKVNYRSADEVIIITCKEHGDFKTCPNRHLAGKGCKKCYRKRVTKTLEQFVAEANKFHNFKYEYTKTIYLGLKKKIIVTCLLHGDFIQRAGSHLKSGCLKCSGKFPISFEDFQNKSNIIHGYKYSYEKDSYINVSEPVDIICPKHGKFKQRVGSHLSGAGCFSCLKVSKADFIKKSNEIHNNKYDYSKSLFKSIINKTIIICFKHGEFKQSPKSHLKGAGCPNCSVQISKPEVAWLDSLNIPKEFRNKRLKINDQKYQFDALDIENKIVYEFYGDYYHGNPKKFDHDKINPTVKKTFKELYQKTIEREEKIKVAGYKIISIWEFDFKTKLKT
jgi:hypothetical protein